MTVMILTKKETKLNTLYTRIESDGFHVIKVNGSAAAVKYLSRVVPDIIIINLNDIPDNLEMIIRKAQEMKIYTVLILSKGSSFDYLKMYGKYSDQILPEDDEIIINHLNNIRYQKKILNDFSERFELFDKVIDSIKEGIAITDENERITYANNKFCQLTGVEAQKLIDQPLSRLLNQSDYLLVRQKLSSGYHQARSEVDSLNLLLKDKHFPISIIPFISSCGKRKGSVIKIDESIIQVDDHKILPPSHSPEQLLNSISNVIFETDSEGRWIFLNKAWEDLTGYSINETLGKPFSDFLHPGDIEKSKNQFYSLLRGDHNFCRHNVRIRNKNGNFIWTEIFGKLTDKQLENSGTAGTITDISERIKFQNALEDSERKFHAVFENSFDAILLVKDDRIVECNQRATELFKIPKSMLVGSSAFNIPFEAQTQGSITPEKIKKFMSLAAGGETQVFGIKLPAKDGSFFDALITLTQVLINDEIYFQATIRDISEKKKKDQQLENRKLILGAASQAASRFLQNSNWEIIIDEVLKNIGETLNFQRVYVLRNSTGKNNEIVSSIQYEWAKTGYEGYKNNPALKKFSWLSEEFSDWKTHLSKGDALFGNSESFPDEQRKLLEKFDIKTIAVVPIFSGNIWWGNLGFDDCIGGREWSETEIEALKVIAGTFGAAILRSRIEKNLMLARDEAETANRLKSQFLANMSHELRTPLVGILGFAEILSQELTNDSLKDMSDSILSAGKRLFNTLNSLFDLTKIENRNVELKLVEIRADDILTEVVNELIPEAEGKNLILEFNSETSGERILADKLMFNQSCRNIIQNAIKYTHSGKIEIKTEPVTLENKNWVRITCIDTGIGIPESHSEIIFEEFRQVSEGYNRNFEGIGLGLTITKKFIELMGGRISVKSKPGKGSQFSILMPVAVSYEKSDSDPAREITAGMLMTKINIKYSGRLPEILIVEDDESNLEIVRLFISKICEITSCTNSAETLKVINEKKFDAVIMDINLEEKINGIELTKIIRQKEGNENLPVIALTAYAMKGDREYFLSNGFNEYIPKPFNKEMLYRALEKVL
ncbi:MAG: hypothetical protein Kow0098_27850 [Ignavibacteriaceae bacterium]